MEEEEYLSIISDLEKDCEKCDKLVSDNYERLLKKEEEKFNNLKADAVEMADMLYNRTYWTNNEGCCFFCEENLMHKKDCFIKRIETFLEKEDE